MMAASEGAEILSRMSAADVLWPYPLDRAEALHILDGGELEDAADLLHVSIPTESGLGRRAILPGGFAYTSAADEGSINGRVTGPDGRLATWLINGTRGTLTAAVVTEKWEYSAVTCGVLFVALVSSASAAGLGSLDVLIRLDRPDAVAAMGHAFGLELRRLVPARVWSPGMAIR